VWTCLLRQTGLEEIKPERLAAFRETPELEGSLLALLNSPDWFLSFWIHNQVICVVYVDRTHFGGSEIYRGCIVVLI
jgi:hypothetical protein